MSSDRKPTRDSGRYVDTNGNPVKWESLEDSLEIASEDSHSFWDVSQRAYGTESLWMMYAVLLEKLLGELEEKATEEYAMGGLIPPLKIVFSLQVSCHVDEEKID
tara:strand:- start:254 stop:568 length:315 start_codon:yes stop_codon:yes gene_type:complete